MGPKELLRRLDTWIVYNIDLDNINLPMYKEWAFIYEAIHSHAGTCKANHDDWKEETEKILRTDWEVAELDGAVNKKS
ncbi:hypothetical protein [Candidatus Oleimmundimicrobium sp.]|uniref:hypothetical protein n=1 Tax=Candidatus Oleimmundimicrobium sp. TaxID=3060597 RepID=UPI00271EFBB4|nr:hypothetical protein [Candidatus Oleimmundimicrobium sp.]MDO8885746.1 hypothetical protein [Candidatus Oleimmundimicrobium sp.]